MKLPGLVQALDQRRLDQAEVMAQQQRLLALIAGTAGWKPSLRSSMTWPTGTKWL